VTNHIGYRPLRVFLELAETNLYIKIDLEGLKSISEDIQGWDLTWFVRGPFTNKKNDIYIYIYIYIYNRYDTYI